MFMTFILGIVMKNVGENMNVILLYITCRFPTKILYAFSSTSFVPHLSPIFYYLIHQHYLMAINYVMMKFKEF